MGATNMQNNPYVPWPSKILDVILGLEREIVQTAPLFSQDQKIYLEKGRTAKDSGGIPVREFQLTVEYTTKEEN